MTKSQANQIQMNASDRYLEVTKKELETDAYAVKLPNGKWFTEAADADEVLAAIIAKEEG